MARSATSRKPSGDTVPCLVAIATAKAGRRVISGS